MGEWVNDKWCYLAKDIGDIINFGHSDTGDWKDAVGERADVKRAMKALKIKYQFAWDAANYQLIASYLNGGK